MSNPPQPDARRMDAAWVRLFAPFYLRSSGFQPFIEWATRQLVEGRDAPSLRILAGLSGDDSQETEFHLNRALQELGLAWPKEKDCLLQHCAGIAGEMVRGQLAPAEGYSQIYQVALHLDYPRELLRWVGLETEFYPHEGAPDEKEQLSGIIRSEACRFLALMGSYERTGIFRLTPGQSFEHIRAAGFDAPEDAAAIPTSMPSSDDEVLGLSFFRTSVFRQQFDYLTIPRTYFGRSEVNSVTFEYSDLSESRLCWNNWQHCQFAGAKLSGCDLRRSRFKHCYFHNADLSSADLRGATFERCSFSGASMKCARLEKRFGVSRGLQGRALRLSLEQMADIEWTSNAGEAPEGG